MEYFQRFVKAEMLLFQQMCGSYGNFTQASKEAHEYTQSVEQMDERKAKKNEVEFVQKMPKRRSSGVMKPPLR